MKSDHRSHWLSLTRELSKSSDLIYHFICSQPNRVLPESDPNTRSDPSTRIPILLGNYLILLSNLGELLSTNKK